MTEEEKIAFDRTMREGQQNVSGGIRHDQGKVRMELLPPHSLEEIAKVFTFGANKYADWNYMQGLKWSRCYGSLMRHLNAWYGGEEIDKETGLSHLAHAACNVMMLLELSDRNDLDDRPIKISRDLIHQKPLVKDEMINLPFQIRIITKDDKKEYAIFWEEDSSVCISSMEETDKYFFLGKEKYIPSTGNELFKDKSVRLECWNLEK